MRNARPGAQPCAVWRGAAFASMADIDRLERPNGGGLRRKRDGRASGTLQPRAQRHDATGASAGEAQEGRAPDAALVADCACGRCAAGRPRGHRRLFHERPRALRTRR